MAVPKGMRIGGRQKGTKNKKTIEKEMGFAEVVTQAKAEGLSPLEYMLNVMRQEGVDQKRRDAMAIAAAPYVHAKLSSIEQKVDSTVEQTITVKQDAADEVTRRIDRIVERGAETGSTQRH